MAHWEEVKAEYARPLDSNIGTRLGYRNLERLTTQLPQVQALVALPGSNVAHGVGCIFLQQYKASEGLKWRLPGEGEHCSCELGSRGNHIHMGMWFEKDTETAFPSRS